MKILAFILAAAMDLVPAGEAFLTPLTQKDSVQVGDRLSYGFVLEDVAPGTSFALPEYPMNDTLTVVRGWQLDTVRNSAGGIDLTASVVLSPFEEMDMVLPPILVQRSLGDRTDTLVFEGKTIRMTPIQMDTATFVFHDLKDPIDTPFIWAEVGAFLAEIWEAVRPYWPYILGGIVLLALLIWLALRRKKTPVEEHRDPAYIVALRALEGYRDQKYWAPDKQKAFYSGVTDALKAYIGERFGFDAPEMTSAEVLGTLRQQLPSDQHAALKDLFERADFVKFAKFTASDEDNAKAVPAAVGFVMATYAQPEGEAGNDAV